MKIAERPLFFVWIPIAIQTALFHVFYYADEGLFFSSLFLVAVVGGSVIFFETFLRRGICYENIFKAVRRKFRAEDRFAVTFFGMVIILLSPLDVYFNGFKLFAPETYAEFYGVGRYIRHITSLCWILVPIAFYISDKRPILSKLFCAYAFVFPIIAVDRNRLFMSAYAVALMFFIKHKSHEAVQRKTRITLVWKLVFISFLILILFTIIGFYRSGSSFDVESSGWEVVPGRYPLGVFFEILPSAVKQIILYITTPVVNFSYMLQLGFRNEEFLLSQFSPFSRDEYSTYPYAPILVERYNVGTEFYPFLLAGGATLAAASIFFAVFLFVVFFSYFKKNASVYTLIAFVKLSYTMLFIGFAPQFYILYNVACLGFVFLMFVTSKSIRQALDSSRSIRRHRFDRVG